MEYFNTYGHQEVEYTINPNSMNYEFIKTTWERPLLTEQQFISIFIIPPMIAGYQL